MKVNIPSLISYQLPSAFAIAIYETLEVRIHQFYQRGFGRGFPYHFHRICGGEPGWLRRPNTAYQTPPSTRILTLIAVPTTFFGAGMHNVDVIHNHESGYLPQTLLWPFIRRRNWRDRLVKRMPNCGEGCSNGRRFRHADGCTNRHP